MSDRTRYIASVSWGKGGPAMLHGLIEREMPLHEVVFYNTGVEFQAIYDERDKMLPLLRERGIDYTELHPAEPFFYSMLVRPVKSRKTKEIHRHGYGWCGGACRWGTAMKTRAVDNHAKAEGAAIYVGIAYDERQRIGKSPGKPRKIYPLVDWGMTEGDCLMICRSRGHTWIEDGVCLYDILRRVSCYCCRNKNLTELAAIREHLPRYWERLCALEHVIGEPMKRGRWLSDV